MRRFVTGSTRSRRKSTEMQSAPKLRAQTEAEKIDAQTREDEARFMRRVDDQIARRQVETRQQLAQDTAALTAQLTKELLRPRP